MGVNEEGKNQSLRVASTASPVKSPPPESSESIRLRTLVISSFWAVVFFLGLPVWLQTTSIHRAHLPLQHMLDWAHGRVWSTLSAQKLRTDFVLGLQTYLSLADRNRCTVAA